MTQIKGFQQLNSMIKEFRASRGKVLSNCYMMPDEIEKHCVDGRVKADVIGDWLIVLFEYEDYIGLCYYTTEDSEVPDFSPIFEGTDKAVMFDIILRLGKGDTITSKKLINAGAAEHYKSYLRQQLPLDKVNFQNFTLAEGYRVAPEYNNYEEFHALIAAGLDSKSMQLPTREKFEKVQREGTAIFVVDEKGELASTEIYVYNGTIGFPLHLATSVNHRRKGLGMFVMEELIRLTRKNGLKMLRCWIEENNVPSLTLCHRLGYSEDGTVCEQYTMKGK